MKLSSNIANGDYFFYCALHGPTMGGFLRVVPGKTGIDSQSAIDRRARAEVKAATDRLQTAHGRMREDAGDTAEGASDAS